MYTSLWCNLVRFFYYSRIDYAVWYSVNILANFEMNPVGNVIIWPLYITFYSAQSWIIFFFLCIKISNISIISNNGGKISRDFRIVHVVVLISISVSACASFQIILIFHLARVCVTVVCHFVATIGFFITFGRRVLFSWFALSIHFGWQNLII